MLTVLSAACSASQSWGEELVGEGQGFRRLLYYATSTLTSTLCGQLGNLMNVIEEVGERLPIIFLFHPRTQDDAREIGEGTVSTFD